MTLVTSVGALSHVASTPRTCSAILGPGFNSSSLRGGAAAGCRQGGNVEGGAQGVEVIFMIVVDQEQGCLHKVQHMRE